MSTKIMDTLSKKCVATVCVTVVITFLFIFEIEGRRGGFRSLRRQRHLRALTGAALPKCGVCDEAACPRLSYCEGRAVKDVCSCCTVCDSSLATPTLVGSEENPCDKVQCPKFKVCTKNIQGLPLCGCPGEFMCRKIKKKKKVCGTNGVTYESRCHMRIASCNQGLAVRKKYKGECSDENDAAAAVKLKRRLKQKARRDKKKSKTKAFKNKLSKRGKKNKKGGRGKKRQKRRNARNRLRNGKSRRRRHNFSVQKTFEEGNWGTWQDV